MRRLTILLLVLSGCGSSDSSVKPTTYCPGWWPKAKVGETCVWMPVPPNPFPSNFTPAVPVPDGGGR